MTISDTSFDWTRDCDFVVAHSILSIVAAPNRNPTLIFFVLPSDTRIALLLRASASFMYQCIPF